MKKRIVMLFIGLFAIYCVPVYAKHHHNDGLYLANGILDLVGKGLGILRGPQPVVVTTPVVQTPVVTTPVIQAPVVTTPVVQAPVVTQPIVVYPQTYYTYPTYYRRYYRPAPPPPHHHHHGGHRGGRRR